MSESLSSSLETPYSIRGHTMVNRLIFGPHQTNLSLDRDFGDRQVAYYHARMEGGVGTIVTESISIESNDWPYEYAPLITQVRPGLERICQSALPYGTTIIAALNHSGGEGTSTYSQSELIGPSDFVDVDAGEPARAMEQEDISSIVSAFGEATSIAISCGVHGVEINASYQALLRQFLSSLTNTRQDTYGEHRSLFVLEVLSEVRKRAGGAIVGLRLCIDELASWGGITIESSAGLLAELATLVDYVVLTVGSLYSKARYRSNYHYGPSPNLPLVKLLNARQHLSTSLVGQGSITSTDQAQLWLGEGHVDRVEMTRALIADPLLLQHCSNGEHLVRPCILCNQYCIPSDPRNFAVSCLVNPASGFESRVGGLGPFFTLKKTSKPQGVHHIVGGGVCAMELALALPSKSKVHVYEQEPTLGGVLAVLGSHDQGRHFNLLLEYYWSVLEDRSNIDIHLNTKIDDRDSLWDFRPSDHLYFCGGASYPGTASLDNGQSPSIVEVLRQPEHYLTKGIVIVDDIGGYEGLACAEILRSHGVRVTFVTRDPVIGSRLAPSGDMVDGLSRLRRLGVATHVWSEVRNSARGSVVLAQRFGSKTIELDDVTLLRIGDRSSSNQTLAISRESEVLGDAKVPRGVYDALLDARRCASLFDED